MKNVNKKKKKIVLRDKKDIPHRFHDTNLDTLEYIEELKGGKNSNGRK